MIVNIIKYYTYFQIPHILLKTHVHYSKHRALKEQQSLKLNIGHWNLHSNDMIGAYDSQWLCSYVRSTSCKLMSGMVLMNCKLVIIRSVYSAVMSQYPTQYPCTDLSALCSIKIVGGKFASSNKIERFFLSFYILLIKNLF